jgi:hypothetical protein
MNSRQTISETITSRALFDVPERRHGSSALSAKRPVAMVLELDDLKTILAGGMPGRPQAPDAPETDEPDEDEEEEKG